MAELLPCPFCGSKPRIIQHEFWPAVKCSNTDCGVQQFTFKDLDRAIKLWNTRPTEVNEHE